MSNDYPEETAKLNRVAEEARSEGIETHAIFIEGVPALSILDLVQKMNADLIVVGTHGHGAVSRLFLGSVSKAIVNKSECPVLLIPSRDS
ncbi:MAG TPA: universal stress protein [Psychromonas sp.]